MIFNDFHMHTNFCDGENSPEQMVQAAIKFGLKKVGLSGHSFVSFDDCCMGMEDTKKYLIEIDRLKEKYKDDIEIFAGLELDYYSDLDTSLFDYTIGSVHFIQKNGKYIINDSRSHPFLPYMDEYWDGDPYNFIEDYYAIVGDVKRKTNCDIIGHFDIVTKFNEGNVIFDPDHERYVRAWKKAADKIGCKDTIFEINFGAISRGFRTECYPAKPIRDYLADNGAKFIFTSDAHSAKNVGNIDIDKSQFEGLKIVDSPII